MLDASEHGMSKLSTFFRKRAVQKLLGVPLPSDAEDLRYVQFRVSSDLAGYDAHIRFRASRQSFLDLVRRRGLALFPESGPNAYLPRSWRLPPEWKSVDWWDAGPETPRDSASGSAGAYGWIAAKYENGHVYMMISDTGHPKPE
jgi:hypothetical protein